ncbi:MAG: hypothetical protein JKY37_08190 [Nannocystaceae bacterium]|nr:hypothetical protein [Nannocystaceae bacterium]
MTTVEEIFVQLERYVSGALEDGPEADAFEELLFSESGASAAGDLALLVAGVRHNNGRGLRHPFCGAKAAAKIRELDIEVFDLDMGNEGGDIAPIPPPEPCDIVVTRYGVDLEGVTQLEIEITLGDYPTKTITGVAFDADDSAIYACCEYQFVAAATQMTIDGGGTTFRFISVEGGERRLLKEFRMKVQTADS